jgi:hypothetical protein
LTGAISRVDILRMDLKNHPDFKRYDDGMYLISPDLEPVFQKSGATEPYIIGERLIGPAWYYGPKDVILKEAEALKKF